MKHAETIIGLIEKRSYTALRAHAASLPAADLAEAIEETPTKSAVLFFRLLAKSTAAEVFSYLSQESQRRLIEAFSDKELRAVIGELFVDDCADLVEEMPASVVQRILSAADPDTRRAVNEILRYPKDSAGTVMTTEYVLLKEDMTVAESFQKIRREAIDKETIYTSYVTDKNRRLLGTVSAKELLLASPDAVIRDVYRPHALSVETGDDRESVAQMFDRYDLLALPVVDKEKRLVGIITVDDAIDVLHAEAEEDFHKMAAMTPSDTPYLRTSVLRIFLSRIPWLCLLLLSATFTGAVIASFENALAACVVLTAFIPMLMDTGGNSGSQASVTVIRGLSLGEIRPRDAFRVLLKELRVSLLCGASLAVVAFLKVLLIDHLLIGSVTELPFEIAFTVSATLLLTVVAAKVIGCLLPILAKRIGFDPAVMASPFITTIVDAVALIVYFRIASVALLPLLS